MVCSGMAVGLGDEDPYDYVMRRSDQISVTINPCCGTGIDTDIQDDALFADLNAYANSLSFGDVSISKSLASLIPSPFHPLPISVVPNPISNSTVDESRTCMTDDDFGADNTIEVDAPDVEF